MIFHFDKVDESEDEDSPGSARDSAESVDEDMVDPVENKLPNATG